MGGDGGNEGEIAKLRKTIAEDREREDGKLEAFGGKKRGKGAVPEGEHRLRHR